MMCQSEAESSSLFPADPSPAPEPLYFGPPARRLFGWYHAPTPEAVRDRAVVLCAPLGHEALYTHASYRYLAEQLAAAGFPTLRFDYDGTGDSAGDDEDTDRVGSWLKSIGEAVSAVRQRSCVEGVSLFGVRMGATLAAVAAAERGDISELLLWAACRSGRLWRRELRVLQAAHGPQNDSENDIEEAGGFVFTRPTVEALDRLDTAALLSKPADAVLLIGRDDLPADTRLGKHLMGLGTAVTGEAWPGYAAMMRDAQDTEIPIAAIGSLISWLTDRTRLVPISAPISAPVSAPVSAAVPAMGGALADMAYTEEPLICRSEGRLFGILTQPRFVGPRSRAVVVLLNVGANSHVGPNRMYVVLARQLAALGFSVLRLDTSGLGDSAVGAAPARQKLYSDAAIGDVRAALTALETQIGAEQFTLLGLCSGAYTAFLTAFADPRVTGQVLINSQTLDWKEGDSLDVLMRQSYKPTGVYLEALSDPHVWKRVLSQQVDVRGISRAVRQRLAVRGRALLGSALSLVLHRTPYKTPAEERFHAMIERGTDTLFLFAAEDAGLELTLLHLGTPVRKINALPHTRLALIENADHTFTSHAARAELLALTARHLQVRFPV